jgi:endoribonuclease Dicer
MQGAMVANLTLGALCVDCGYHTFLIHESPILKRQIDEYVEQVTRAQALEYNLAESEKRPPGQYWVDIEAPKVCLGLGRRSRAMSCQLANAFIQALSDIIESSVGALLVLDNFNLSGAERMYNRVIRPFFEKHISLENLTHHPTKVLFELFQSRGCQKFEIVENPSTIREDAEGNIIPEGYLRCDGELIRKAVSRSTL